MEKIEKSQDVESEKNGGGQKTVEKAVLPSSGHMNFGFDQTAVKTSVKVKAEGNHVSSQCCHMLF